MPIQYDDNGLTIQTQTEIVSEREQALQPTLGNDFSIEGDSVVGNLQASDTDRELDIQEALAFLVNQMSITGASGIFLDFYGQFKSLTRNATSKTIITRTVRGTAGTSISMGSLIINDDDIDLEFILNNDIVLDEFGAFSAPFIATVYGATNVSDGDSFSIITPLAGVTEVIFVTGDGTESEGIDAESDEDFRARIIATNNINSVGITSGIAAKIGELDNVQAVTYLENKSSTNYTYEEYVDSTHTITATVNSFTINGSGTAFLTDLDANYSIKYTDDLSDEQTQIVSTIASDTQLTTVNKSTTAATGVTYSYAPPVLPPNSFEIIVLGGDADEIAETIFLNQVPTTETIGNTSVLVTDSEGQSETVKFTIPDELTLEITADVYYTTVLSADEKSALVDEFVDYLIGLQTADSNKGMGMDVDSGDFGHLSNTNAKVQRIRNIQLKLDTDISYTDYISVGIREIISLSSSNINLSYIAV